MTTRPDPTPQSAQRPPGRPSRWPGPPLLGAVGLGLLAPLAALADEAEEFGDRVRAYLLQNPEVILEAMDVLASRQAAEDTAARVAAVAETVFDPSRAVFLGNPDAPFKIVELFDYRCHSCKAGHPALEAFVAAHPEATVMIQQLPILGPQSDRAARAYLAVHERHGAEVAETLHEALFAHPGVLSTDIVEGLLGGLGLDPAQISQTMYGPEVSARVDAMKDAAIALGAVGTPVFVTERSVHQGMADAALLEGFLTALK